MRDIRERCDRLLVQIEISQREIEKRRKEIEDNALELRDGRHVFVDGDHYRDEQGRVLEGERRGRGLRTSPRKTGRFDVAGAAEGQGERRRHGTASISRC